MRVTTRHLTGKGRRLQEQLLSPDFSMGLGQLSRPSRPPPLELDNCTLRYTDKDSGVGTAQGTTQEVLGISVFRVDLSKVLRCVPQSLLRTVVFNLSNVVTL